jgi:hypothetical protein
MSHLKNRFEASKETVMRLKVTEIDVGLHPSQVSVSINARDGLHYLVINRKSLSPQAQLRLASRWAGERKII